MSFVYILKNNKEKYYIGITNLLVEERLQRHNKGDVKSTKLSRPWKICYIEEFDSLEKARAREKQIKSWHSGNAFKKLIHKAGASSNGRTAVSGTVNRGSSPCTPAL